MFTHASKVILTVFHILVITMLIGGCESKSVQSNNELIGDINLNGIAYEIADAVLYTKYFVFGMDALTVDAARQRLTSDVNKDNKFLTVPDFVCMVRKINGEVVINHLTPVTVTATYERGIIGVNNNIGAALIVMRGETIFALMANHMDMIYSYDSTNNVTRIFIYSLLSDTQFSGDFLIVDGTIESIEMATYDGYPVKVVKYEPAPFLHQNVPNPFQYSTTIVFALPIASNYLIQIFDYNYIEIERFAGFAEAGMTEIEWDGAEYQSANYHYRLIVGEYTIERTMTLSR